jgi:hypothetical protein
MAFVGADAVNLAESSILCPMDFSVQPFTVAAQCLAEIPKRLIRFHSKVWNNVGVPVKVKKP